MMWLFRVSAAFVPVALPFVALGAVACYVANQQDQRRRVRARTRKAVDASAHGLRITIGTHFENRSTAVETVLARSDLDPQARATLEDVLRSWS